MSDSDSRDRKKAKKQQKKDKKAKKKAKKLRKKQKKALGQVSSEEEVLLPAALHLGMQVPTKAAAQELVRMLFLFLVLSWPCLSFRLIVSTFERNLLVGTTKRRRLCLMFGAPPQMEVTSQPLGESALNSSGDVHIKCDFLSSSLTSALS